MGTVGKSEINKVYDPACGSAGFLLSSAAYVGEHQKKELMKTENLKYFKAGMFSGFDTDQSMLRIGAMNMMLHGVENPNIKYQDSLSGENTERDAFKAEKGTKIYERFNKGTYK